MEKDLIEYIAKSLVDDPSAVSVTETEGEKGMVLQLKVADNDIGKVIGKYGRIAKAMRTVLSASATKDGKVIAVLTTAQYETDNIGSACMNASFYSQFNGKTEADYSDIEGISGATITTNGYKTAIGKVFEAVKILEGVA